MSEELRKRITELEDDLLAANDICVAKTRKLMARIAEHGRAFKYIDGQLYTLVHTKGALGRSDMRSHLMKAATKAKQHLPEAKPESEFKEQD